MPHEQEGDSLSGSEATLTCYLLVFDSLPPETAPNILDLFLILWGIHNFEQLLILSKPEILGVWKQLH